jgi:hypothetical protein
VQLVVSTAQNAVAFAAGRQRFYPGIGAHLQALYASVSAAASRRSAPRKAATWSAVRRDPGAERDQAGAGGAGRVMSR